jgi:hypothetical protein
MIHPANHMILSNNYTEVTSHMMILMVYLYNEYTAT